MTVYHCWLLWVLFDWISLLGFSCLVSNKDEICPPGLLPSKLSEMSLSPDNSLASMATFANIIWVCWFWTLRRIQYQGCSILQRGASGGVCLWMGCRVWLSWCASARRRATTSCGCRTTPRPRWALAWRCCYLYTSASTHTSRWHTRRTSGENQCGLFVGDPLYRT